MRKLTYLMGVCCLTAPFLTLAVSTTLGLQTYGPVQSNETIWSISRQILPPDNSVTMNQVMVSLAAKNPNALIGGNINGLMRDKILSIPSVPEMQVHSPLNAAKLVERHYLAWEAHRPLLAEEKIVPFKRVNVAQNSGNEFQINTHVSPTANASRTNNAKSEKSSGMVAQNLITNVVNQISSSASDVLPQHSFITPNPAPMNNNKTSQKLSTEMIFLMEALKTLKEAHQKLQAEFEQWQTVRKEEVARLTKLQEQINFLETRLKNESLFRSTHTNVRESGATADTYLLDKTIQLLMVLALLTLLLLFMYWLKQHYALARLRVRAKKELDDIFASSQLIPLHLTDQNVYEFDAQVNTTSSFESASEPEKDLAGDDDLSATLLDLAMAYVDMGDLESAKETLLKVIENGDEKQRVEAESLLKRIAENYS